MTPAALALSQELADELGQQREAGLIVRRAANPGGYFVSSENDPKVWYSVLVGPEGDGTCTCGDYEHRRGECKHIREVKKVTTALTPIRVSPPDSALPTVAELESMDMIAAHLIESKAVAIPTNLKTKEDVRAVIMAGWEWGVKPMSALRHVAVINGKTEPDAQLMMGIVMSKEQDARFEVVDEQATGQPTDYTTVRLTRPARGIVREYTYYQADAVKAGLAGKQGPWTQFPRDMRRWAAAKRLARAYCSDLINGITSTHYGEIPDTLTTEEPDEPRYIEGTARLIEGRDLYNEGDEPANEHGATQEAEAQPQNAAATGAPSEPPASPPDAIQAPPRPSRPAPPAPDPLPVCKHERVTYDDRTGLKMCAVCSAVLEEPPGGTAQQTTLRV